MAVRQWLLHLDDRVSAGEGEVHSGSCNVEKTCIMSGHAWALQSALTILRVCDGDGGVGEVRHQHYTREAASEQG